MNKREKEVLIFVGVKEYSVADLFSELDGLGAFWDKPGVNQLKLKDVRTILSLQAAELVNVDAEEDESVTRLSYAKVTLTAKGLNFFVNHFAKSVTTEKHQFFWFLDKQGKSIAELYTLLNISPHNIASNMSHLAKDGFVEKFQKKIKKGGKTSLQTQYRLTACGESLQKVLG